MAEIYVNIRANRFFESEEIVLIQINGLQEMEQLGMLLGQTAQGSLNHGLYSFLELFLEQWGSYVIFMPLIIWYSLMRQ